MTQVFLPVTAEAMPVAALRSWVRSLGGELEIAVALPDGRRVQPSGLDGWTLMYGGH